MKKSLLFLATTFSLTVVFNLANAQGDTDTVTFETPSTAIVIDTNGGTLWQIGIPFKTFFLSAHSGTKAILTDTINDYPPNDTSSFIYIIRNPLTQTCLTCMGFWHKYDMDSLLDKGIIDASYDGGNSWFLLKDANDFPFPGSWIAWQYDYHLSTGVYNSHQLIASGKSDGWIQSLVCWQWWLAVTPDALNDNPDSMMIRFTFISDSVMKNKEGWMIDDIVTSNGSWQDCSGIKEIFAVDNISVSPNPFYSYTTLSSSKILKKATLSIFNSTGQPVKQIENISGLSTNIFRDNLPIGMYFLRLTENNKIIAIEKLLIMD